MDNQPKSVTYNLKVINGLYLPVKGRELVTTEDVEAMIAGLQATLVRMQNGETISEIFFGENQTLLESILAGCEWHTNEFAHEYCYEPYKPKPGVSGECVYFMLSRRASDRIKIGSTIDLYNRTKEHHQTHESKNPYVIALCKTPQYRQLERLLHKKFIDHHTLKRQSEWFAFQPVFDWLHGVVGGAS